MMEGFSEEEDQFFDAREDNTSVSDSGSDRPENLGFSSRATDFVPVGIGFEVWVKDPESIHERRDKFLKWMGLGSDEKEEGSQDGNFDAMEVDVERIMGNSGAVLRNSGFDDGYSSSQSSMSCWSNEAIELLDGALKENLACRIKNLDDGIEFIADELGQNGLLTSFHEVGSNRLIPSEEFERTLGLSPLIQRVMRREVQEICNSEEVMKQVKRGWLRRLGALSCIVDRQVESGSEKSDDSHPIVGASNEVVRVRPYRKQSKELSALYVGQDILAHKGSILTMKFSPDGQYLASAGEDGVVRIWQVTESERSEEFRVPDVDPSFVYFTGNHLSELVPLHVEIEKMGKLKSLRKASGAACVIFPQKVFWISENPLHEFHGHNGEVLDLSWSKNKFLLSSSVDNTVRLWRVGSDQCLKIFSHNNYVTSVEFNPVDDDYFISGSIDGKVRIWSIPGCQVVAWTEVREIVTAVCYRPDGKGGIIGSMSGICYFYDASDNRLQLHAHICLQGKKKSPFKRITAFQFSPSDPNILMVSSADSQLRILHGIDVIGKYRGLRNSRNQISASFTSDGTHIIAVSEDSNIYMWNNTCQDGRSQTKSNWS
ncbi:WD repeat-containing protein isoform 2 [Actinidia chinensis var. chinensis]|nr:WD repeat-containing protein isoform 2 [Actinidia chinensis var. chinensis]